MFDLAPCKPLVVIGIERVPDNPQPPDAAARWPDSKGEARTVQVAPGVREKYLPSRTHETDLPGADFSTDDVMRYHTHLRFDFVADIREMYGTKGK